MRAARLKYEEYLSIIGMSPAIEPEPQKSLKRVTWQYENCLSCVWFSPSDPINADIMERGKCVHAKLKGFDLVVSGRDWCNLFTEIRHKQIDLLQEKAMEQEGSA